MPLIKQTVKKNYRSNDLTISTADLAVITPLLAGVVDVYTKVSEGGTDILTPANLRSMSFGVSRPADSLSATVRIKHLKSGKHANDVFAHVGLFDADWNSSLSATKIRQIYQGAKA